MNIVIIISEFTSKPSKLMEAVTLLFCIWDVLGWNLGQNTNYPD
jgi:hypothetical protein